MEIDDQPQKEEGGERSRLEKKTPAVATDEASIRESSRIGA